MNIPTEISEEDMETDVPEPEGGSPDDFDNWTINKVNFYDYITAEVINPMNLRWRFFFLLYEIYKLRFPQTMIYF